MKLIPKNIPSWVKRIKYPLIIVTSTIVLGIIGYLFIIFGGRFVFDERNLILPETTTIVAEDGETIGKLYTENREIVTIEQIPDHVENAFIAVEDQRFYEHAGVSFPSVIRAVYRDIIAMQKVEGGSTITQQLAKNLFLKNDKTWMRKTKEVMASIYLERNFSKKKILEYYLNEIYFAHGIYGVGTAAEFYFNKDIEELTITEGAMLAAMAKAPNTYSPLNNPDKAKERRDLVLQQMNGEGMIETAEMMQLQGRSLGLNRPEKPEKPWIADYVDVMVKEAENKYQLTLSELRRGGYEIVVHLNEQAQKIAYEQMQKDSNFHGSVDGIEGSFILMNEKSGGLEAIIGGRDFEYGTLNRALVPRQPGSAMKPLAVYGPAMMLDEYGPYTMIPDEAKEYDGYLASNANGQYDGSVTMYEALKTSKNAPPVWLLNEIGIGYSKGFLEKMGIKLSDNGLAIALGGLETGVTPIQLVEGYRTFVHSGEWVSAHTIKHISNKQGEIVGEYERETKKVFSPQVAWNMVRMLEAVVKDGTAIAGEYEKDLAGKTGSTQHPHVEGQIKDAWFVGFTPNYVTSLWMGYDRSDESHYLTKGSEAPTVLTKNILRELDQYQTMPATFEKPSGVEELPAPVELPTVTDLTVNYKLGGFSLVRGEMLWTHASDQRIVYRIYKVSDEGEDELIGTVEGKGSYTIDRVSVFRESTYYLVPYDPVTNQIGEKSNYVQLSWDD